MPLIKFSGRATFSGRNYRREELCTRVQGMDISPGWFPSPNSIRGDILFCSEKARSDRTRAVLWFVGVGNPIYDFADLFEMWASAYEADTFARLIAIDMPNESSRLAAKYNAESDEARSRQPVLMSDATPDYTLTQRLADRRAALGRVHMRRERGLTYETIPRLGEPVPRDMLYPPDPVTAEEMTHTNAVDVSQITHRPPDQLDRMVDDMREAQVHALGGGEGHAVRTAVRMLRGAGLRPEDLLEINGVEGITVEDVRSAWDAEVQAPGHHQNPSISIHQRLGSRPLVTEADVEAAASRLGEQLSEAATERRHAHEDRLARQRPNAETLTSGLVRVTLNDGTVRMERPEVAQALVARGLGVVLSEALVSRGLAERPIIDDEDGPLSAWDQAIMDSFRERHGIPPGASLDLDANGDLVHLEDGSLSFTPAPPSSPVSTIERAVRRIRFKP